MNSRLTPLVRRSLWLYLAGQLAIVVGAGASHVSGSLLPLALTASAALLLTVRLVRDIRRAARSQRV